MSVSAVSFRLENRHRAPTAYDGHGGPLVTKEIPLLLGFYSWPQAAAHSLLASCPHCWAQKSKSRLMRGSRGAQEFNTRCPISIGSPPSSAPDLRRSN